MVICRNKYIRLFAAKLCWFHITVCNLCLSLYIKCILSEHRSVLDVIFMNVRVLLLLLGILNIQAPWCHHSLLEMFEVIPGQQFFLDN